MYKRVQPSKSLGEKCYEIKGGGHEMVAMMLMIIKLIMVIIKIYYHQHYCSHYSCQLSFHNYFKYHSVEVLKQSF